MASSTSGGGYDYEFVDGPPQEILICKICLMVCCDPYLSVCCGHVFCKSCIDNTKQNTAIVEACPVLYVVIKNLKLLSTDKLTE